MNFLPKTHRCAARGAEDVTNSDFKSFQGKYLKNQSKYRKSINE